MDDNGSQIQSGKPSSGPSKYGENSTDTSMMSNFQPQNEQSRLASRLMDQEEEDPKQNLWRSLLQSVGKRTEATQAHILLLGDRNAGKKSLIKAMNKPFMKQMGMQLNIFDEIGSEYSLFESSFLYARDLFNMDDQEGQQIGMEENLTRINVWVISEIEMATNMIPKVLTPEDLEFTFAIIVPDLEQPWDLMNQCEKWMKCLKESIFMISPKLKLNVLEQLKERMEELYKTYKEPELDKDGKLINKKIRKPKMTDQDQMNKSGLDIESGFQDDQDMMDDLRKQIELPEGILVTNIFIPSAIVCSKVDLIEHGDKEIKNTLEQNIDFIQYQLRKFCLLYGSSLMFASSNSSSNVNVIYDYILHRIYDTDFVHKSKIDDKEALFVPTGFDSPDLISQVDMKRVRQGKNIDLDEIQYNDMVKKPVKQSQYQEERKEIECPDWRKTLEAAYSEKEQKQQHKDKFMGKMKGVAGAAGNLGDMRRNNAGGKTSNAMRPQEKARPDADKKQAKTDAPANTENGDAASKPAEGAADAERNKKARVKDFYSSLLQKKKTDKNIGAPAKTSKEGAETEVAQAPEATKEKESQ